jgi:hypothetical protein
LGGAEADGGQERRQVPRAHTDYALVRDQGGAWDYLNWGHVEPLKMEGRVVAAKLTVYAGSRESALDNGIGSWLTIQKVIDDFPFRK